ncbi:hypothetical protein PIB30_056620 [Stylosanthes scabra]|uniref:Uncharacterized protein n=1 Tax=Stylosanthes scabra TaxID=79078 RepID=A0ABU6ZI41_9FABA|nr:hypothetical protein [Stylosanthes scabra]
MKYPKWKESLHHGQSRTVTEVTRMPTTSIISKNDHDTEDCRDFLEFVEKGLKKGKFHEYTGRSSDQKDDRRTRQRVDSPEKSTEGKDEPKDGMTRREIKMISEGQCKGWLRDIMGHCWGPTKQAKHKSKVTGRQPQLPLQCDYGKTNLNRIGAVVATSILTMKFTTDGGKVGVLRRDKQEAEKYYNATLHISKEQLPKLEKPDGAK